MLFLSAVSSLYLAPNDSLIAKRRFIGSLRRACRRHHRPPTTPQRRLRKRCNSSSPLWCVKACFARCLIVLCAVIYISLTRFCCSCSLFAGWLAVTLAQDSLKLGMTAVDQIFPLLNDLFESLGKISSLRDDWEGKVKVKSWLGVLTTMKASDELDKDQVRQIAFDLERCVVNRLLSWSFIIFMLTPPRHIREHSAYAAFHKSLASPS